MREHLEGVDVRPAGNLGGVIVYECLECLKAKQRMLHMRYAEGCQLCGARKLAYMARVEREKIFDAIQHVSGYEMRREAERLVALERARIDALASRRQKTERIE